MSVGIESDRAESKEPGSNQKADAGKSQSFSDSPKPESAGVVTDLDKKFIRAGGDCIREIGIGRLEASRQHVEALAQVDDFGIAALSEEVIVTSIECSPEDRSKRRGLQNGIERRADNRSK